MFNIEIPNPNLFVRNSDGFIVGINPYEESTVIVPDEPDEPEEDY